MFGFTQSTAIFCLQRLQLSFIFPVVTKFLSKPQLGQVYLAPPNATAKKGRLNSARPNPGSIPIIVITKIAEINIRKIPINKLVILISPKRFFATVTVLNSKINPPIFIVSKIILYRKSLPQSHYVTRAPTLLYVGARQKFRLLSSSFTFHTDLEKTSRSEARKAAGPQPQYKFEVRKRICYRSEYDPQSEAYRRYDVGRHVDRFLNELN
ncbi:hypothetical protein CHCC14566_0449 [Bacillus licheniformis]|nr:hypothetical protein CHCC14566_0449 [Bacillus licheniformis]